MSKVGLNRRVFLRSSLGVATAFVTMASDGKGVFAVARAATPSVAVKYAAPVPLGSGSQAGFANLRKSSAVRVAFMPIAPEFSYYAAMRRGVEEIARRNGVETFTKGPSGSGDNNVHVRMMDEVINQDISALIVAVRDATLAAPVIRRAVDRGIVVVVVNSDLRNFPTPVHAVVGYSNRRANRAMGEYAVRLIQGRQTAVGIIEGAPGYHSTEVVKGFYEGIRNGSLKVVASSSGGWSLPGGEEAARAMLQDHPKIGLVFAANDNMIVGALRAAQRLSRSNLILLGRDGDPNVLHEIKNGTITATTDTAPLRMGQIAMQVTLDALNRRFRGGFVETPTAIIDRSNVSKF